MKNIKYFFPTVKTESINEEDYTLDVVASTGDRDRDGDIILPSAYEKDIQFFKANPVILTAHRHELKDGESPVVANAIPETIKITKKTLEFKVKFAIGVRLGQHYWYHYSKKFMRALSVGFMPIEWKDGRDTDGSTVRTYTKVELLETSVVAVPSNRFALAKNFSYEEKLEAAGINKRMDELASQLDEIKSLLLSPDSKGFAKHLLGDAEETDLAAGDKSVERISEVLNKINNTI